MNKYAIFHLSESPYSYPTSQDTFFFRLRMAKEDKDLKVHEAGKGGRELRLF